jgi:hypothetical protein
MRMTKAIFSEIEKRLNSPKLQVFLESAAIFCLPLLVKAIFGLPRLMLQNFTDGVFYLGYAMHFQELVDRVGLNYYAVRFGAIFRMRLLSTFLVQRMGRFFYGFFWLVLFPVRFFLSGGCISARS